MKHRPKPLEKLIERNNTNDVDSLDVDGRSFFELITLITDIKYRIRYGENFEEQRGRGYSKNVQSNNVVADHLSPVDDGLLRH